jgi:hypothetical protein
MYLYDWTLMMHKKPPRLNYSLILNFRLQVSLINSLRWKMSKILLFKCIQSKVGFDHSGFYSLGDVFPTDLKLICLAVSFTFCFSEVGFFSEIGLDFGVFLLC